MNDDHNLRRKMREEADDCLFMDIRFDERMKERIRARVQAEEQQQRTNASHAHTMLKPSVTFHIEPGFQESETTEGRCMEMRRTHRRRWAYGVATVASLVVAVAITFSQWMSGGHTGGKLSAQPEDMMVESTGNVVVGQEGVSPLATGETGSFDVMSHETSSSAVPVGEASGQILSAPDDASNWFGEPVKLPSYVPDGYRMDFMAAVTEPSESNGVSHGMETTGVNADTVRILYVSDAGDSYELTIRKWLTDHTLNAMIGETIELNGTTGYWQQGAVNSLQWRVDHLEYQLQGTLDKDEMIRIAASVSR